MAPGTCQYCGCTDAQACEGGCTWTDDAHTVCSQCSIGAGVAQIILRALTQFHPAADLWVSGWDDRPLEERQLLVMAARAILEAIPSRPDLDTLREELQGLLAVLEHRFPDQVARAREQRASLAGLVTDILDGPRIVLAGRG